MNAYEQQIQASAKYHHPAVRTIEQNGGELGSPVVSGNDEDVLDWADVLEDLERFY